MTNEPPAAPDDAENTPASGIDPAKLRNAMKAFKKTLKLARLDDESRLGHGAMTSGGKSGITAIAPPARYPEEIWIELVRQGRLRKAEFGMYELPSER